MLLEGLFRLGLMEWEGKEEKRVDSEIFGRRKNEWK